MSPCFSQIQIDQIEQIDQTDQIDEIDQMNEINEIDEIEIAISQAFPCYSSRRKPDISLAKETLGWSPRLTIEEGLPKTIDYFDNLLRTSKGSSGFIAITHFFSALTSIFAGSTIRRLNEVCINDTNETNQRNEIDEIDEMNQIA